MTTELSTGSTALVVGQSGAATLAALDLVAVIDTLTPANNLNLSQAEGALVLGETGNVTLAALDVIAVINTQGPPFKPKIMVF
jgi:hypothetical protein